jgi:hypothetical protein
LRDALIDAIDFSKIEIEGLSVVIPGEIKSSDYFPGIDEIAAIAAANNFPNAWR